MREQNTIVPNYLADSGYTEDIPSRSKVGDAQGKSKIGIIKRETGDVTCKTVCA